jgi:hypothetical protein
MIERCRRVVTSPAFPNWVLAVIVLNALLIGRETDPETLSGNRSLFRLLKALILEEIEASPGRSDGR